MNIFAEEHPQYSQPSRIHFLVPYMDPRHPNRDLGKYQLD